uniref:Uncharacterized protein n=1 Tax=Clytia hemisphaerica TaxID=252671 RepID=A0A7M6DJL4_9CNID
KKKTTMASICQKILLLGPSRIDPTKCHPGSSLYAQIKRNGEMTLQRQQRQFNLGNSETFSDPIIAADYLLEREYGETALFDTTQHGAVFIPPTFMSYQYKKKSTVAVLDYDVKKDIERLLHNLLHHSPNYWFTTDLRDFISSQGFGDTIDQKYFSKWILNLKIKYLIMQELNTDEVCLPPITLEPDVFIKGCIQEICSKSIKTSMIILLGEYSNIPFKRLLRQKVDENPPTDSNLRWLFDLEISELGEKVQNEFYDKLSSLQDDDVLSDTVVLSSIGFITNVRNRMQQELDFFIISWPRKLIICIESKRTITDRIFEQLEMHQFLLETKFGDQLGHGWTFFPVILSEFDKFSFSSRHYITTCTDIKSWLVSIFQHYPVVPMWTTFNNTLSQTKDVLRLIIFTLHASKHAPITTTNWVEYINSAIDNVATSDNILFYSKEQLAVMSLDNDKYNKLIITAGWGTGKSLLLTNKAIQMNSDPYYKERVMYVLANGPFKGINTMLYHRLKFDLEKNHGIFVKEIAKKGGSRTDLLDDIKQHKAKAMFIDEFDLRTGDETVNKILELCDMVWIVPSTESMYFNDNCNGFKEQFTTLNLSHNFRNCRSVVKSTKMVADETDYLFKEGIVMPPSNFPSGTAPTVMFVRSIRDAVSRSRKITMAGILVIKNDFNWNQADIEMLNDLNENWKIYSFDQNDFQHNDNPYTFLQDGNILVIDGFLAIGFEWPVVIVFEDMSNDVTYHECNYMMRCSTNLLIVKKPSQCRP